MVMLQNELAILNIKTHCSSNCAETGMQWVTMGDEVIADKIGDEVFRSQIQQDSQGKF